jgi:DNA-binding IclR family transcriptional regulator
MNPAGTGGAQAVRRAVSILRVLATGQERGVRLTDIVGQTGLNRPTVHRILRVLVEEGAVEQDAQTRRYMVGQEVSLLGLARTSRFPVRAAADPYLRHLADEVGDTIFLTIRSGSDSICIDRKTGDYPVKVLSLEVGGRRPLGVGVAGVSLLAGMPAAEATEIVKQNAQRFAAHDLTAARVLERVRAARTRGYAYADAGLMKGTRALALAVHAPDGEAVAAVSVAALADRLSARRLPGVLESLREQCALVERRLAVVARTRG